MKLPRPVQSGVPSAGRVPDQSYQIEARWGSAARGLDNVSQTLAAIEEDRLDQQAKAVEHEYLVEALNLEANEMTKDFYEPNDPALEGLSVPLTEKRLMPNGELEEVPREHIPADEVWPELLTRSKQSLLEAKAEKIQSKRRRDQFTQAAEQRQLLDNLRLLEQTTKAQYAREQKQREFMAEQYREMGAWDQLRDLVTDIKDPDERRVMKEWFRTVKEVDGNTATIADSIEARDAATLETKWKEYLDYTSGDREYKGVLDKDQLEDQANRFYSAMRTVNTLSTADNKMFLGAVKYEARQIIDNNQAGYQTDPAVLAQTRLDLASAAAANPGDETLYSLVRQFDEAQMVGDTFRDVISTVRNGSVIENIVDFQRELDSNQYQMDPTTQAVNRRVSSLLDQFRSDLRADPMTAIQRYGLETGEAPIMPVDFTNLNDLDEQLAAREAAYQYYQGVFEYTGDILTGQERASLEALLENEMLNDNFLATLVGGVVAGSSRYANKIFGPSINDKQAGRYMAIGQLMVDYEQMQEPGQGMNIARRIMRGFDRWSQDPTILEDYVDARSKMRELLDQSYAATPGMVDNYMDLATAYVVAGGAAERGQVRSRDIEDALTKIAGGSFTHNNKWFMAPRPGLTQRRWDEWLNEYSPTNIQKPLLGWSSEELVSGLRRERMTLVPTGLTRGSYYVLDPRGQAITYQDREPFVLTYDPQAEKRFTR